MRLGVARLLRAMWWRRCRVRENPKSRGVVQDLCRAYGALS